MSDLRVPEYVESPFRAHFRDVVLGSLVSAADREAARQAELGHRRRARRAEDAALRIRAVKGSSGAVALRERGPLGRALRPAIRAAWLVAVALLVGDVAVFGIHAWTTTACDLTLIALTFAWFALSSEDLRPTREPPGRRH